MTSDEFEELLTLAFDYDGKTELDGATGIVDSLAEFQGSGLQDLMWYGYDNDTLIGDHYCVHDTEELPSFKAMKKVSFSIQDLGLVADRASHKCDMDEDEFFIDFTARVFPETMETLILWDCRCSGHVSEQTGDTILLERAMIKLMTSGSYRKLKAVFLEDLERPRYGPRKDVLWFQEVVAAGATAGVDVNILTNRKTMQHSIEFLEASDEYDLISGVHSGVRPSNWVFNP
ncbi:hypothetical protein EKO04_008073 [Ascochyta lentis]|uniref:Uncharacterized protein n=1 Tax=Ascochyta lentis TaxID=205686 RepID=A0A8H7J0Q9_9PLEO|nr:hypothetical protein EKO04_008073 [Ascochyta lentis]